MRTCQRKAGFCCVLFLSSRNLNPLSESTLYPLSLGSPGPRKLGVPCSQPMDLFLSRAVNLGSSPSPKTGTSMYNHNRPLKTVCFQKTRISTVRKFHIGMVGLAWGDHTLWSSLPDPSPMVQETTSTQLVWHTLIVHAVNASDDLGQRRGC